MDFSYFDTPKFLAPLDNSKSENDFSVLTDRESIRHIAKDICDTLHHPVTIFDINRLGTVSQDDIRIDSDIEYFSLRNSCRLLRHCAGVERCHKCDEYHARVFKEYLTNGGILDCKDWPPFFYQKYYENLPQILIGFERAVFEYHCPMLGYRELLFPIYIEDNLIGILFLGQSIVKNDVDEDLINSIVNDFFNNNENNPNLIFKEYLSKICDKDFDEAEKIKQLIINADKYCEPFEKYFSQPKIHNSNFFEETSMVFENIEEYYSFINKACKKLRDIEQTLLDISNKKKEMYFNQLTKTIVSNYFNRLISRRCLPQTNKYRQRFEELQFAWEEFIVATQELKTKFSLTEIYLFGDGTALNMEGNRIKHLYYPMPKEDDFKSKWEYDFSSFDSKQINTYDYACSLTEPKVLDGLNIDSDISDYILIIFSDIAMLLSVNELQKNKKIYKEMANAIGRDFVKIRFSIALCTANLMKERHVLTLRMNKHESSHISTRLIDNMRRYFAQKGQTFLELDKEKQEYVVDDMLNTIKLISHMANNIGIITGSINYETIKGHTKRLDVFDMLYKWQIMFRDRLTDRNLDIKILRETEKSPFSQTVSKYRDAPRYLTTHPDLFELLVYNLVDNAVKYAYRGSTIYLSWRQINAGYKLSISSFGPQIKENERVYDLYTRGSSKHHNSVDGDGIGLYVVKRISNLLGITVSHKCQKIAQCYLPLIDWYINEPFRDSKRQKKQNELKKYRDEYNELILKYVLNNNVHTVITRRDLSEEYLDSRIDRETWLTQFDVFIPFQQTEY